MVKIRLTRMGEKKIPMYRIVVADERTPRDGRVIAEIGSYNPTHNKGEGQFNVDVEEAKKWLANGAQPTQTVANILKKAGIK